MGGHGALSQEQRHTEIPLRLSTLALKDAPRIGFCYCTTGLPWRETPLHHSLWGWKVVGMEGLAPGWVRREDLLMVLLSLYPCSWINLWKLAVISVSTNYNKVWGPAPLGALVSLNLIRHLPESQQSLYTFASMLLIYKGYSIRRVRKLVKLYLFTLFLGEGFSQSVMMISLGITNPLAAFVNRQPESINQRRTFPGSGFAPVPRCWARTWEAVASPQAWRSSAHQH